MAAIDGGGPVQPSNFANAGIARVIRKGPMSAVNKRTPAQQSDPLAVLSGLGRGGDLASAIRQCLESIRRESGCTSLSVTGMAGLALWPDLALLGRRAVSMSEGDRVLRVPQNGQDMAEPYDRPADVSRLGEERHRPLLIDGIEKGGVVLRFVDSRPTMVRSGLLDAWLGLLALLCEAAIVASDDLPPGCLGAASFFKRLRQECRRCAASEQPFSLLALSYFDSSAVNHDTPPDDVRPSLDQVASQLKERLRPIDAVGRDRAAVWCLLSESDALGSQIALARIEKEMLPSLATEQPAGVGPRWIGASVTFPQDGETEEELLASVANRQSLLMAGDQH